MNDTVIQLEYQLQLISEALSECIIASGIVRPEITVFSGPEVLMFSCDLARMLRNKQSEHSEFNKAIDFAIQQGSEASQFLDAWRHGDTSEWPEYD